MNKYTGKKRKVTKGAIRRRKMLIRQYTLLLVVLVTLLMMIPTFMAVNASSKEPEVTSYSVYTVQKNDTLWNIAKDITDKDTDVRQIVYEIRKLNNIDSAEELMPGQQIVLPYTD